MVMPFHAGATVNGFPFFRLVIQLNQSLTTYLRRNIATVMGYVSVACDRFGLAVCRSRYLWLVGFFLP